MTAVSEVVIKLLVVSTRDGNELVRVFTNMWLETLGSAAIEVNTQAVKGMLKPVIETYKVAIRASDGVAARCMLRIGLSSLVESIEKKSAHTTMHIAMTWISLLDMALAGGGGRGRVWLEATLGNVVKEIEMPGDGKGETGTPGAFLVLLLAALARNLEGLMSFIHKTPGESFDTADRGPHGDLLKKVAGEFKQIAESGRGTNDLTAATKNGKFGAAAKRLVQRKYRMRPGLEVSQFRGIALPADL